MLHYAGALSGQRAMATALVLEADGRWAYGVLNNLNSEDPQNVAKLGESPECHTGLEDRPASALTAIFIDL